MHPAPALLLAAQSAPHLAGPLGRAGLLVALAAVLAGAGRGVAALAGVQARRAESRAAEVAAQYRGPVGALPDGASGWVAATRVHTFEGGGRTFMRWSCEVAGEAGGRRRCEVRHAGGVWHLADGTVLELVR